MATCSARWTLGRPEFKSSATLVNCEPTGCLLPVKVFNYTVMFMLYLNYLVFKWSASKLAG